MLSTLFLIFALVLELVLPILVSAKSRGFHRKLFYMFTVYYR